MEKVAYRTNENTRHAVHVIAVKVASASIIPTIAHRHRHRQRSHSRKTALVHAQIRLLWAAPHRPVTQYLCPM
jgi:hypothetical protein